MKKETKIYLKPVLEYCGKESLWKIWGRHSSVARDSGLLECDDVSLHGWLLTFWIIIMPSSSQVKQRRTCLTLEYIGTTILCTVTSQKMWCLESLCLADMTRISSCLDWLTDRNKNPFVTCPAVLSAPDGESPVLLPVPPLFLLAGPAVLAQPGSGVRRHLQSPAPVCRREETVAKYAWVSDSETR